MAREMKLAFLISLTGFVSLSSFGLCGYLPRTHWAYDALAYLSARGLVENYPARVFDRDRMLSRRELGQIVSSLMEKETAFSSSDWFLVDKLVSEFAEELKEAGVEVEDFKDKTRTLESLPASALGGRAFLSWEQAEEGGQKSLGDFRVNAFVNPSEKRSLYSKLEAHWGKGSGNRWRLERFIFDAREPKFNLQIGRDYLWWGPGFNGTLMVSDNAPSFEFVQVSYLLGSLKFKGFSSVLDADAQRFLLGHKLEFSPTDGVTFGLSESVIISGRVPEPYYLLSSYTLVPFYLVQEAVQRLGRPELDDNIQAGFDVYVSLKEGVQTYAEFLIDDIIVKAGEQLAAHKFGYLMGVYFHDPECSWKWNFRVEFAHLDSGVYLPRQRKEVNKYYKEGHCLGHWLGDSLNYPGQGAQDFRIEVNLPLGDKLGFRAIYGIEDYGLGSQKVEERRNTVEVRLFYDILSSLSLEGVYRKIWTLGPTGGQVKQSTFLEVRHYF